MGQRRRGRGTKGLSHALATAQGWSHGHPGSFLVLSFAAAFVVYAVTENGSLESATAQALLLALLGVALVAIGRPRSLRGGAPAGRPVVMTLGACLCVIAVIEAVVGWQPSGLMQPDVVALLARAPLVVTFCLATGVFEEALFRIVAFKTLAQGCLQNRVLKGHPLMFAAAVSSVLFALLHIHLAGSPLAGDYGGAAIPGVALKAVQAVLFGFVMATMRVRGAGLDILTGTHALYDLIVLGPALLAGDAPLTMTVSSVEPFSALVVSAACLVPVAVISWVLLRSSDRGLRSALLVGDERRVACIL